MKKTERETVFKKYGGKCAYCGYDLVKGWHVDHLEPCQRKTKWVKPYWNGEIFIEGKWVSDGFYNPDANHMDNYNPSCASCNILKGMASIETFRKTIANFINSLNSYTNQYKFVKRYGLVEEINKPVVFYFETL